MQTPVAVALLYQTNQFGGHLRDALKELGAAVVYEALTADVDRDKLEGSGARVVIVNLDPETEAYIDHVYDLLDEGDYEVVFNEAQVSANLSGWDHARWARNLAAKVLKQPGIAEPPRPAGAEAVPTPVQKSASTVPVADKPGEHEIAAGLVKPDFVKPDLVKPDAVEPDVVKPEVVKPESAKPAPVAAAPIAPAKPAPSEQPTMEMPLPEFVLDDIGQTADAGNVGLDIGMLDEFADLAAPPPPEPPRVEPVAIGTTSDFAAELDALFAAADAAAPATSEQDISLPSDFDLAYAPHDAGNEDARDIESIDIPFDLGDVQQPPGARIAATDAAAEPHEFPAIFDQLDAAAAGVPEATDGTYKPGQRPSAPTAQEGGPLLPPEWNLEPFDDGTGATGPVPTGPAKFGIEKVAAADYLAPHVESPSAKQAPIVPDGGFSLELLPMEEAVAQQAYQAPHQTNEAWLDSSRPAPKLKVGTGVGIERVFVLGASIGGPEAVREFLDALPAGFPMLFILVQHMGEEFLELMSAQLAKAVALTVRNPTHGERVGPGEILVVPTTHRLQVDTEGVVTLMQLPAKIPYSPWIDQVLRDVADEFGGKAGAIIFSGMAHDAIEGSQYLHSKGGVIWAQDPDTCVVSSMVDGAREAGVVSFVGSPKQLAAKMLADYGKN